LPENAALDQRSDHLTLLGLASDAGCRGRILGGEPEQYALILVVLALANNWVGDSLDGTLARFRNCQRPRYGYYVDHVIDLIGTASLLTGLALSGYMNRSVAFALLSAFALVEAEVYLATHVQQVFRLSCFRIGPTELRVLLAVGTLYLPRSWAHRRQRALSAFDIAGIIPSRAYVRVISAVRTPDLSR
jgi:phosphatidylglycerophosphate synthase